MSSNKYYEQGHSGYKMSDLEGVDSRIQNVVESALKYTQPGCTVLDVGCGDMYLASRLRPYERQVVGLDLDSTAAGVVKHDLSVRPYPVPRSGFSAVICSEVLEHLWKPEDALAEMRECLVPNGHLIVTVPNFDTFENLIGHYRGLIYHPDNPHSVEHIRQYTAQSLSALAESVGFVVREVRGNSPHMSVAFSLARAKLRDALDAGYTATQMEADQLLGRMFPDRCPGIMIVAQKR